MLAQNKNPEKPCISGTSQDFVAEKAGFEPALALRLLMVQQTIPFSLLGYFSIIKVIFCAPVYLKSVNWRRDWDSNPGQARTYAGFQDRCLKPTRPSLHIKRKNKYNMLGLFLSIPHKAFFFKNIYSYIAFTLPYFCLFNTILLYMLRCHNVTFK